MLGRPKPRHLDVPVAVSLEALVPANHFYRHLEAKLDGKAAGPCSVLSLRSGWRWSPGGAAHRRTAIRGTGCSGTPDR
jgi:hypothetical protein